LEQCASQCRKQLTWLVCEELTWEPTSALCALQCRKQLILLVCEVLTSALTLALCALQCLAQCALQCLALERERIHLPLFSSTTKLHYQHLVSRWTLEWQDHDQQRWPGIQISGCTQQRAPRKQVGQRL